MGIWRGNPGLDKVQKDCQLDGIGVPLRARFTGVHPWCMLSSEGWDVER